MDWEDIMEGLKKIKRVFTEELQVVMNEVREGWDTGIGAVRPTWSGSWQAIKHTAGIEAQGFIHPSDVEDFPAPVQIKELIRIYEIRKGSLLDWNYLGMSLYPVGIFVDEGVVTDSTELSKNWVIKEEVEHWWQASQEGGSNVLTSPWNRRWLVRQIKGMAIYGSWEDAYDANPMEIEGGLYGGRLSGNEVPPTPWYNSIFELLYNWGTR